VAVAATMDYDDDDDDDDDGLTLTLLDLTMPLRIMIFNYLGETQDELTNLTLTTSHRMENYSYYCNQSNKGWWIDTRIISAIVSPSIGQRHKQEVKTLYSHESE
jgi:hypothetical protein